VKLLINAGGGDQLRKEAVTSGRQRKYVEKNDTGIKKVTVIEHRGIQKEKRAGTKRLL